MQAFYSPVIGSVSHEVGNYGPRPLKLGMALTRGEVFHRITMLGINRFASIVAGTAVSSVEGPLRYQFVSHRAVPLYDL